VVPPSDVTGRLATVALVAIFTLWSAGAGAADHAAPPRRAAGPPALENEEPDLGDQGEVPESEAPDADQGNDDEGSGVGRRPRGAPLPRPAPSDPSAPGDEEEEPSAPPDSGPVRSGPAEPANAMQPLGQGE
jgi:hypothetical protein